MELNHLKAQLAEQYRQRVNVEDTISLHRALGQDMEATTWEQQHLTPMLERIDQLKTTISRLEGTYNVNATE